MEGPKVAEFQGHDAGRYATQAPIVDVKAKMAEIIASVATYVEEERWYEAKAWSQALHVMCQELQRRMG